MRKANVENWIETNPELKEVMMSGCGSALRTIEVTRLDELWHFAWQRLHAKDNLDPDRTLSRLLQISERRAKLLGLDVSTGKWECDDELEGDLCLLSDDDLMHLRRMRRKMKGWPPYDDLHPVNEVFVPE
jgi:hypothetical protein